MRIKPALAAAVAAALVASCAATDSMVWSSTTDGSAPGTTEVLVTSTTSGPMPSTTTTTRLESEASWIDRMAGFIETQAEQGAFSGSALIGVDNEILWQFAAGLADRDENLPNQVDTLFNLGSMSKMFTAVAVLQLMEQGEISVDDTVAQVLPDYPNRAVAEEVTIRRLLTHTSGMGDTFTPEFAEDPNRYRSNADFLPLFVDQPPAFPPGTSVAYSNAGFVVLGMIIEQVSGRSYYNYVRDHVFGPTGMSRTDSYAVDDEVANLALGYTTKDFYGEDTGVMAENTPLMPGKGFAAGGGYSTCGDLFRFSTALLDHQLLSPQFTRELLEPRVDLAPGISQGYGFLIGVDDGSIGHTGGAPGICSFMSIYPESGYTVVVLSNSDNDCRQVLDFLRSDPPEQ